MHFKSLRCAIALLLASGASVLVVKDSVTEYTDCIMCRPQRREMRTRPGSSLLPEGCLHRKKILQDRVSLLLRSVVCNEMICHASNLHVLAAKRPRTRPDADASHT